jgi:hypothetical protein
MTLFETTKLNVTCDHVIYIWTLILCLCFTLSFHQNPLFTVEHVLTRMVTHYKLCNELLYKLGFDQYIVYVTRFDAT